MHILELAELFLIVNPLYFLLLGTYKGESEVTVRHAGPTRVVDFLFGNKIKVFLHFNYATVPLP